MPRVREFKSYSDDGKMGFVETEMKDGKNADGTDRVVEIKYNLPATPADFRAWVMAMPDATKNDDGWEGPLADVHTAYWAGLDMKIRADKRESTVAESTIIKVDKKDIDLMLLPVDKAILAINGVFAVAAATGKDPQNAYVVTRRKLLETGKVQEQGGILTKAA